MFLGFHATYEAVDLILENAAEYCIDYGTLSTR